MQDFIRDMPKAELHVHLEGTLEPEHVFALAERNQIEMEYKTPAEVIAAYNLHDLPSFLTIYYAAMGVLQTEQDFFELTRTILSMLNLFLIRRGIPVAV